MSYDLGDLILIQGEFRDPETAGSPRIDPSTVTFKVKTPSAVTTSYVYGTDDEVVRSSLGLFHMDVSADEAGSWAYRIESTGTGQAAAEGTFDVKVSSTDGSGGGGGGGGGTTVAGPTGAVGVETDSWLAVAHGGPTAVTFNADNTYWIGQQPDWIGDVAVGAAPGIGLPAGFYQFVVSGGYIDLGSPASPAAEADVLLKLNVSDGGVDFATQWLLPPAVAMDQLGVPHLTFPNRAGFLGAPADFTVTANLYASVDNLRVQYLDIALVKLG